MHVDDFQVRYWGEQWEGGSIAVWTKNRGERDMKRNQVSFQPTLISFGLWSLCGAQLTGRLGVTLVHQSAAGSLALRKDD